MSTSETTVVPGNPAEWRDFDHDEYDPKAEVGGDDDALGELLDERAESEDPPFGIVIVVDPTTTVNPDLIQRLAGALVPTKVRRESRAEGKPGEKKEKKPKKDKDKKDKKDKDKDED